MDVFSDIQHIEVPAKVLSDSDRKDGVLPFPFVKGHTQRGAIIPEILLIKQIILGLKFLKVLGTQSEFARKLSPKSLLKVPAAQISIHTPENIVTGVVFEFLDFSLIPDKSDSQSRIQFPPIIIRDEPDLIHIVTEVLT